VSDLTPEELDEARAEEARRIYYADRTKQETPIYIVQRLAREGWTPPPKVDPDLLAAREWCATSASLADAVGFRNGDYDKSAFIVGFLAGAKHGRANP
jgi:hypothetical protein